MYQFDIKDYNSFWKIHCFTFFSYKNINNQTWPCHKIGQGQHRVIIFINLVGLEHPMQHTKFQGHRFFKVFTIYGHGSHLGHVTWTVWTNFRSPIQRRFHMKFDFDWPSGFRGEISKSASLFLLAYSFFFSTIFCLFFIMVTKQSPHNDFGSRIWSKMFFRSAGLKNWQTLRLIILDIFTGKSFSSDRRMYLDAIIWCGVVTHTKTTLSYTGSALRTDLSFFALWIMGNIMRIARRCSLIFCPQLLAQIG